MPFAMLQISVANLDLNSTNTMEGRCHTTKIFRFRGTTFKTLTNPGSYPANPSLINPGTTKSRLRKFRGAKVQTQKNIEQNYNFFFLTFSTLHLCTLQIFTIYFGCSGSVDYKNSHDLPSPLPPQNNARITLHACSTLRLEGQHCLVGVRGREHEP